MDAGGHSMQYLLEKEFDLKKTFIIKMSIQSTILFVEKEINFNENVFFRAPHKTISWKKRSVSEFRIFMRIFTASLVPCVHQFISEILSAE